MIKLLLFISILLSSCSKISSYYQFPYELTNNYFSSDITSIEKFNESPFSFVAVKVGNFSHSLMPLVSYENDLATWVGNDKIRIISQNGRVILSKNLDYNFSIQFKSPFIALGSSRGIINLYDPYAPNLEFFSQTSIVGSETVKILGKSILLFKYKERVEVPSVQWSFTNYYWLDTDSRIIKSIQNVHPNLGPLKITYYFKY